MANQATLEALRRLAERPGTEHEGNVAREMLRKLEAKLADEPEDESPLIRYLRTNDMDGFLSAIRRTGGRWKVRCSCGAEHNNDETCRDVIRHEAIRMDIRVKFPLDSIVYYNYHAYEMNAYAMVAGYPIPKLGNWGWIRLKLAGLQSVRAVPIYSPLGYHISLKPVSREEHEKLAGLSRDS